ncbi:MAG: hypothetical protein Q4A71_02815 [Actinomycetaceae bacterium]|nr:hypothetical protein [Actinomycetaceae bacterium]
MPNNEFGDFQTPLELAVQCLKLLNVPANARVLEPTCGRGAFLQAATLLAPATERIGFEINRSYVNEASKWGKVRRANIFKIALPEEIPTSVNAPLFVIGNPPWVTSAELKRMGSDNVPKKENFKSVKGLDVLLGASNFDVCEYIILKILREFATTPFTFGMLCKTHVARNVIEYAANAKLPISNAACYRIDAKKWFNANVNACWFTLQMNAAGPANYTACMCSDVFDSGKYLVTQFGVVKSLMVADIEKYSSVREADGVSPYEWRSGLKHDATQVFELLATPVPTTKGGTIVDLEP